VEVRLGVRRVHLEETEAKGRLRRRVALAVVARDPGEPRPGVLEPGGVGPAEVLKTRNGVLDAGRREKRAVRERALRRGPGRLVDCSESGLALTRGAALAPDGVGRPAGTGPGRGGGRGGAAARGESREERREEAPPRHHRTVKWLWAVDPAGTSTSRSCTWLV